MGADISSIPCFGRSCHGLMLQVSEDARHRASVGSLTEFAVIQQQHETRAQTLEAAAADLRRGALAAKKARDGARARHFYTEYMRKIKTAGVERNKAAVAERIKDMIQAKSETRVLADALRRAGMLANAQESSSPTDDVHTLLDGIDDHIDILRQFNESLEDRESSADSAFANEVDEAFDAFMQDDDDQEHEAASPAYAYTAAGAPAVPHTVHTDPPVVDGMQDVNLSPPGSASGRRGGGGRPPSGPAAPQLPVEFPAAPVAPPGTPAPQLATRALGDALFGS